MFYHFPFIIFISCVLMFQIVSLFIFVLSYYQLCVKHIKITLFFRYKGAIQIKFSLIDNQT